MDETFSFRWGIPLLDEGHTVFPNHFFRVYHQVISKEEWLFICHLATYKYESRNGECRPSLATVAKEMGYAAWRSAFRLKEKLQKAGYLRVISHKGRPSTYDFTALSRALMGLEPALSEKDTDTDVITSPDTDVITPPDTDVIRRKNPKKKIEEKNSPSLTAVSPQGILLNETPQERIERLRKVTGGDYLGMLAHCETAQIAAGGVDKAKALVEGEGAPANRASAFRLLQAFCALVGVELEMMDDAKLDSWAKILGTEAVINKLDQNTLAHCIDLLGSSDEYKWKTYSSPFQSSFRDDLAIIVAKYKAAATIEPQKILPDEQEPITVYV